MSDPIADALAELLDGWRTNVPSRITRRMSQSDILEEIFGRTRAPGSTWQGQTGAALATRAQIEEATADASRGIDKATVEVGKKVEKAGEKIQEAGK